MKYQVVYMGNLAESEIIAQEIKTVLPAGETALRDLTQETVTDDGDVYLIGFGLKRGVLPLEIMDLLETLDGKILLFYVLCGPEPMDEYKQLVEYKMAPFMPDRYDYRGMILCPGGISKETAAAAYQLLQEDPENECAAKVVAEYESAEEKPGTEDLRRICRFVQEKLNL